MEVPTRLYSTDLHTTIVVEGDQATVSFTGFSCERMEEMVALEFRQPGDKVRQGEPCGSVDVMKALVDIPAPVTGTIVTINSKVIENPDLSREDPLGEGWLLKLRVSDPAELDALLPESEYEARAADK